jgi:ABC-type sugar transport system ATPase subunit
VNKETNIVLTAEEISKEFPGVKALDKVSMDLREGEVHALVGENGAGKSTLMQILAGIYKRDEGIVSINGVEHELESKHAAEKAGISIVFQESSLLQKLTVLENLFSGEPPLGKFGLIDWKAMNEQGATLLKDVNIDVDPQTIAGSLSTATQKMIEIARALSKEFKILILDEPTASITVEETEQLFTLIRKLTSKGKSIIYISHRIKEIIEIADRVSVLKDGRYVGTYDIADITEDKICERMVGRELLNFNYQNQAREKVILKLDNLSGDKFSDISFSLKEGEFLTITGLTGAGRTELALSLFGALSVEKGTITVGGKECRFYSPQDAMKAGIGYVTEDRKGLGLFLNMSVCENMESNNIDILTPGPFSSKKSAEDMALKNVSDFNIRCSGISQKVQTLSGGNQQKVCLSRWISYKPRILIVDEPTLGVDVGSKEEIYTILNQLSKEGMTIIMISSDMIETLSIGDRIMVMYEGRMMKIMDRDKCSEEDIVALASGIDIKR